jgi:glyoxylase I family protein
MGRVKHIAYVVSDLERSARFYEDVLGFRMIEESIEDAYDEWILLHPGNKAILCLQQHRANRGEEFDPTRTGGDHVGFKVGSRADLEEWERWFDKNDVEFTPTVDRTYGSVLTFKDPDRFQLELFYRENHP